MRSLNARVAVISSVTNSVTCGAVNADATIAAAVCLRTPLMGMRVSPAGGDAASSGVAGAGSRALAAASTSARTTTPSSPLGGTAARSTPSTSASLRTGGLARGRSAGG